MTLNLSEFDTSLKLSCKIIIYAESTKIRSIKLITVRGM